MTSQTALGTDEVLEPVRQGRQLLMIAVAFLLASSLVTIVVYVTRIGPDRLPQQAARLVLTALLGYSLLQGRAWARWVLVALLAIALFAVVPFFLAPGTFAPDQLASTLPLLVLYLGYAVIVRGLLYSESVRAFFRAHRDPAAPR